LDEVRLPDLETIRRFSIAVRQEHAPVDDVIDALRTDLERLERAAAAARTPSRSPRTRSTPSTRRRTR
jgi:hypothetical protein